MTETKEKKAEVQIKTGEENDGAESIPNSRIICYMGCSLVFVFRMYLLCFPGLLLYLWKGL